MSASDFPSVVSPRMAGGGAPPQMAGAPQGPPGALSQAAVANAGAGLMNDVQAVKAALQSVIVRLRQLPGIDMASFDQGVSTLEQGLTMIGASVRQAVPR